MGRCITPYDVKKEGGKTFKVPCSRCPECKKRRVSGWSFRLIQEYKICETAFFITLTYDTKHVEITNKGFLNLNKKHVQKFFKRLRKAQFGNKKGNIRYYVAGEYGSKTFRPHYHIILYNADINLISPAWNLGTVHFGTVNEASVGYTLKYINKATKIPLHKNDDRQKEFSLMSKGLGKNYLTPKMIKWHKSILHERVYCNIPDNKKIAMPRYYKDKIYNEIEKQIIGKYYEENPQDDFASSLEQYWNDPQAYQSRVDFIYNKQKFKQNNQKEKL
jgi:hypothetical protein